MCQPYIESATTLSDNIKFLFNLIIHSLFQLWNNSFKLFKSIVIDVVIDLRQMSKNLSVTMDMCVHSMKHFKRTYQVCTKLNSEVSSQIMDMFKIAHEKLHNVPIPNKEGKESSYIT